MVFICRIKIYSCQCLSPVHMNFKSFITSILLTSFRFQFSAFRGCFSVCTSLGATLRQLHASPCVSDASHSTKKEFPKNQRWKFKAHVHEFRISISDHKTPRRWNREQVLVPTRSYPAIVHDTYIYWAPITCQAPF